MSAALLAHGELAGLNEIRDVGRDARRGGYSRHVWQPADLELRAWFVARAGAAGLDVETDRNGNLWAWWGAPGPDAVVTGSHLDSVPGGGAFDGPLGVVSALEAIGRLRASGFRPSRPCAVVVFAEEEGSRFGVACLGSRLMTGQLDADRARALVDAEGVSLAEAARGAGLDPSGFGVDREALGRIGLFIELHVEQGRGLIDLGQPLALASSILAHGRWRLTFRGEGNHAGATPMQGRRDPMAAAGRAIVAVERAALAAGAGAGAGGGGAGAAAGMGAGAGGGVGAEPRATVGRIEVVPGGTNVIASTVTAWLDARATTEDEVRQLVARISDELGLDAGADEGHDLRSRGDARRDADRNAGRDVRRVASHVGAVTAAIAEESWADAVTFDRVLSGELSAVLGGVPVLASGAGHDAGVLAPVVPSAMLFVRNPTGISHAADEFAEADDCVAGVEALETLLRSLL
ncbi:allantoate amidohydrolase [Herbiconiux daphne]|uniref:Allantoate amidohydrolase n=1 Tax=Herbiconiux daphne TaxID=2970914 RepID=A0ABT2GYK5_9MICO|nr:allantoate amidohydrolase [Herbiconiux daphne]MCS5732946.1 allantoate amidohydrolase [Herbiconiux daphne]